MEKNGKLWALRHGDRIIWVGRFKPTRVTKDKFTYWADCNGIGPIEGAMGAKLCFAKAKVV